jgi:hypothetical protein
VSVMELTVNMAPIIMFQSSFIKARCSALRRPVAEVHPHRLEFFGQPSYPDPEDEAAPWTPGQVSRRLGGGKRIS